LTLDTAVFFAGAALRASALAGAFFAFAADLEAVFLTTRSLAGLRDAVFAAGARLAFAFAVFAFTGRFAVFADAPRPVERDPARLRPFVRLLLILRLSDAASREFAAGESAELSIASPLNQFTQEFKGT
jgi:hypothetical protein